jgi:TctA family transporter
MGNLAAMAERREYQRFGSLCDDGSIPDSLYGCFDLSPKNAPFLWLLIATMYIGIGAALGTGLRRSCTLSARKSAIADVLVYVALCVAIALALYQNHSKPADVLVYVAVCVAIALALNQHHSKPNH